MTTAHLQTLTSYCKATADQQRLLILRVLSRESFGVLELCHILDTSQPALSHHLKILAAARLVESRREGTFIYYRRALIPAADPIRDLRQSLIDSIDALALAPDKLDRIREVYEERADRARAFFEKNAHRFRENQDLIAAYPNYSATLIEMLDNEKTTPHTTAVEVGPGDSDLILALADRFEQVVAIDNTREMLEKTRHKAQNADVRNIVFIPGELNDFDGECNLLIVNMVLHHLAAPARFFQQARQRLVEGGRLLIADLCAHDQDWTRESCGDLWLGFEPADLDTWAVAAGLSQGQSAYLGLNNGFQVQVRTYHLPTLI